jgi:hypothetical protein
VNTFWIKGIGLLVLLLMAVRVSITPGVRHQHEHGDHPHTHHHHSHGSHSHSHEPAETKPVSKTTHVHIFIFGWEFAFDSPFADDDAASSPAAVTQVSEECHPQMEPLPLGPVVTNAASYGTLIGWVFDLKSPAPPARLALLSGHFAVSLFAEDTGFSSRDRDKPMLPPPEIDTRWNAAC